MFVAVFILIVFVCIIRICLDVISVYNLLLICLLLTAFTVFSITYTCNRIWTCISVILPANLYLIFSACNVVVCAPVNPWSYNLPPIYTVCISFDTIFYYN